MTTHKPVMLDPSAGEILWFFGGLVTFKATAEQTGGEFVLVEQLLGVVTPMHIQPTESVSWYVLDGEVTFYCAGGERAASTGSFAYVPPGAPHAFRVESETVRMLNLNTAQHDRFFRAAGVAAPVRALPAPDDPRAAVDEGRVAAAAARFGVEIVGPPPAPPEPDPFGPPIAGRA
jgi:quercetin dioxygenase-like cupin family protein